MIRAGDGRKSKIRETGSVTLVDENICLVLAVNTCASSELKNRTPFKSPCTMLRRCMYSRPAAASASYISRQLLQSSRSSRVNA